MTVRLWLKDVFEPYTYYDVEYIAVGENMVQLFNKDNVAVVTYQRTSISTWTVNK